MPIPHSYLDRIRRLTLEPPEPEFSGGRGRVIRVEFVEHENQAVFLNAVGEYGSGLEWVLNSAFEDEAPMLVLYDPKDRYIVELRNGYRSRVGAFSQHGERLDVELPELAGSFFLDVHQSDFNQLAAILHQASTESRPVILADDPRTHRIVDVRIDRFFVPNSLAVPPPDFGKGQHSRPSDLQHGTYFSVVSHAPVTLGQARDLFALVLAEQCDPIAPTNPCIPFLYPDEFCYARAHKMCKLIVDDGVIPSKLWAYHTATAKLLAVTPNHPDCQVQWNFHVAPLLQVDISGVVAPYVIDPSLFDELRPQADWYAALNHSSAPTATSDWTVYRRYSSGGTESDNSTHPLAKTRADLRAARRCLRLRSIGSDGPPPYSQCLSGP